MMKAILAGHPAANGMRGCYSGFAPRRDDYCLYSIMETPQAGVSVSRMAYGFYSWVLEAATLPAFRKYS